MTACPNCARATCPTLADDSRASPAIYDAARLDCERAKSARLESELAAAEAAVNAVSGRHGVVPARADMIQRHATLAIRKVNGEASIGERIELEAIRLALDASDGESELAAECARADAVEREREDLAAWKESAMRVMAEWEPLRVMVAERGGRLGHSVAMETARLWKAAEARVDALDGDAAKESTEDAASRVVAERDEARADLANVHRELDAAAIPREERGRTFKAFERVMLAVEELRRLRTDLAHAQLAAAEAVRVLGLIVDHRFDPKAVMEFASAAIGYLRSPAPKVSAPAPAAPETREQATAVPPGYSLSIPFRCMGPCHQVRRVCCTRCDLCRDCCKCDPLARAVEEPAPAPTDECRNNCPSNYAGRWRDWHRGSGCSKDDGQPRSAEGTREIARLGFDHPRAPTDGTGTGEVKP